MKEHYCLPKPIETAVRLPLSVVREVGSLALDFLDWAFPEKEYPAVSARISVYGECRERQE